MTAVPGSSGVLTLPFYHGERTPALPMAKAVIYGLDITNTTRANLIRSAMESAVFGLKTGLKAFLRCDMVFNQLVLTGGGSASSLWCGMVASILNLPVKVPLITENAAFGAALQALWCYQSQHQAHCDIKNICANHTNQYSRMYHPDPLLVDTYEGVYSEYSQLVNTMTPLYTR